MFFPLEGLSASPRLGWLWGGTETVPLPDWSLRQDGGAVASCPLASPQPLSLGWERGTELLSPALDLDLPCDGDLSSAHWDPV